MSVRILRRAERDLAAIHRFIARDSRRNADAVVDRLLRAIERLEEHPESGPRLRDELLRERGFRFLGSDGYLVFYKIIGKQVRVYRVLHGRRAYESLL